MSDFSVSDSLFHRGPPQNVEEGDMRRARAQRGQRLYFHFQESAFHSKKCSRRPFKLRRGARSGLEGAYLRTSTRVEVKFGGLSHYFQAQTASPRPHQEKVTGTPGSGEKKKKRTNPHGILYIIGI